MTALQTMLRNQASVSRITKSWSQITWGDYLAMTAEQKAAYDREWWRRVSDQGGVYDLDAEEAKRDGEDLNVNLQQSESA